MTIQIGGGALFDPTGDGHEKYEKFWFPLWVCCLMSKFSVSGPSSAPNSRSLGLGSRPSHDGLSVRSSPKGCALVDCLLCLLILGFGVTPKEFSEARLWSGAQRLRKNAL